MKSHEKDILWQHSHHLKITLKMQKIGNKNTFLFMVPQPDREDLPGNGAMKL